MLDVKTGKASFFLHYTSRAIAKLPTNFLSCEAVQPPPAIRRWFSPRTGGSRGIGLALVQDCPTSQCTSRANAECKVPESCSHPSAIWGTDFRQSKRQKSFMVPPTALIQAMLKGKTFSRVVAAARTDSEALQAGSSCDFFFSTVLSPVRLFPRASPISSFPPLSNLSLSHLFSHRTYLCRSDLPYIFYRTPCQHQTHLYFSPNYVQFLLLDLQPPRGPPPPPPPPPRLLLLKYTLSHTTL